MHWVVVVAFAFCCSFYDVCAASPTSTAAPETITNSVGGTFRLVSPGKLTVGNGDKTKELVVDEPFYIGVTEVTNAQAMALMGFVPSEKREPLSPVESLTWEEATGFCEVLSAVPRERLAKRIYRLPTSIEWEFACRAGTTTKHFFGDQAIGRLGVFAWTTDNSGSHTHFVGQKHPNPLGLYDVYGNVWEFCSDLSDDGAAAVARGGSFKDKQLPHSGRIITFGTSTRMNHVGFRLAMSLPGD